MTLSELAESLPNSLHDAELHDCMIDHAGRTARLDLKLWLGRRQRPELYRPATITLAGLHFWTAEPHDHVLPYDHAYLTIDAGDLSELNDKPLVPLPKVPPTAFVNGVFVFPWNRFIYLSAEAASLQWTGPEEDH